MLSGKRIAIAAFALLMIAVTPIFAELDGNWEGQGEGTWNPPSGIIPLHPWENWEGTVKEGVFNGTWYDSEGYTGDFYGTITAISPTTAYCEGTWSWNDASGITSIGPFWMTFNYETELCKGTWSSYDAVSAEPLGTMWGERVGD